MPWIQSPGPVVCFVVDSAASVEIPLRSGAGANFKFRPGRTRISMDIDVGPERRSPFKRARLEALLCLRVSASTEGSIEEY